mgnify:CR=1 FL=1
MLCFGYEVDEYVFYIIKKRAPGYVTCEPSNRRNAGSPLAAASRRTRSKNMPNLRVTYLQKYWFQKVVLLICCRWICSLVILLMATLAVARGLRNLRNPGPIYTAAASPPCVHHNYVCHCVHISRGVYSVCTQGVCTHSTRTTHGMYTCVPSIKLFTVVTPCTYMIIISWPPCVHHNYVCHCVHIISRCVHTVTVMFTM